MTGKRLRMIRESRGLSIQVVADRTGCMSRSHLCNLELGIKPLDSVQQILALADALRISPSELTRLPIPAPGNGSTDSAINKVRLALIAVAAGYPGGHVLPVEEARSRVNTVLDLYLRCDQSGVVENALPSVIRDVHTSIKAGRDVPAFLDLAVLLHSHATLGWLRTAGGTIDLRGKAVDIVIGNARELGTTDAQGLAVWGAMSTLVAAGAHDVAWDALDSVAGSPTTAESLQLAGALALCRSYVSATSGKPDEADGSLAMASEIAQRTGQGNAYRLGFGPLDVGICRVVDLVESGDCAQAVSVSGGLVIAAHPNRSKQVRALVASARAFAGVKGRQKEAMLALRRAEEILPMEIRRGPRAPSLLGHLVRKANRDAVGSELRRMAYKAGVAV